MKITAIHQPQYLAWLGYFDKIRKANAFCLLDNVQYKKNEWQNRNKIKTKQGWQWLTVPVSYSFGQKICEVLIDNKTNWARKHFTAISTNYSKAKYYKEYIDIFEDIYAKKWEYLSQLNIYVIKQILNILDINTKIVIASEMKLSDDPTQRLIDICKDLGCDTYLAGKDGKNYMDLEKFYKQGIKVMYQDYKHPEYSQLFDEFVSNISIIDLIFNHGPKSIEFL